MRLTVQYDGTAYHGWQRQPGVATVQGALEGRLASIVGERVAAKGASRTDAGVHALGQVAAVALEHPIPTDRLRAALNSRLPEDIAVRDVAEVPPDFEPTADAAGKHYRYRLYRGIVKPVLAARYVWHWYQALDARAMADAARRLVGRRDFRSFEARGSAREDTVRTITRLDVTEVGPELHVDVEGDGFLYRMVRNLVGTLTEVGRGHRPPEWVEEVVAATDRTVAGPTAPPQGLCLMAVDYGTWCSGRDD
jgi:tRNA pseudouridine38-40 synthase